MEVKDIVKEVEEAARFIIGIEKEYNNILCVGVNPLFFDRYYKYRGATISSTIFLNNEITNINEYDMIFVLDMKFISNIDIINDNYEKKDIYISNKLVKEKFSHIKVLRNSYIETGIFHSIGNIIYKNKKYMVNVQCGDKGIALYGPYITLNTGWHTVIFEFDDYPNLSLLDEFEVFELRIVINKSDIILSRRVTSKELVHSNKIKLDFKLDKIAIVEYVLDNFGMFSYSVNYKLIDNNSYNINENKEVLLGVQSYSQYGEDRIIEFIFENIIKNSLKFYLDIGSNHPYKLSNTFLFYNQYGANGICVEANSHFAQYHSELRERDKVLNMCIISKDDYDNNSEDIDFYILDKDGLSSFRYEEIKKYTDVGNAKVINIAKVKKITINDILIKYVKDKEIDLLSIDVEGIEGEILKEFDFNTKRPKVICVETVENDGNNNYFKRKDIVNILSEKGYFTVADTLVNTIFLDNIYKIS